MGETGRYDAFETTLEVLRLIVQQPWLDPKVWQPSTAWIKLML